MVRKTGFGKNERCVAAFAVLVVEANFKEKINQQRLSLREQYIKELETQFEYILCSA